MVTRLLIANRGEIAVRIARTARARGIATVAVYSDADRDALHVAACDTAVRLGPAPSADSYLRIDRLIAAARDTGADAVHPGYGFLAENAGFAEAVAAAGLAWIGPPADAIRAMGPKDAAKRLMAGAGVPVVPGYHGQDQDPAHLAAEAEAIGYPVLIKARAGGGGKGMRLVEGAAGFAEALERARSEARSSFGDDHVLVERFVANPRHIEVQVFADAHGRAIHLFERDCSAQRRHQKVLEEAPAPGIGPGFRTAMGQAAVRAALACGYRGAGTVEFIVDGAALAAHAAAEAEGRDPGPAEGFYFMEMNTRLQVEHPVTEAVTGLDLVALQLDVAEGRALPAQESIAMSGHAVEVRLYAEDPARGFLPQTGRLAALALPDPAAHPGLRVDAGVRAGDTVSPHYDPMIAKIVAHAPTRTAAFQRLDAALADTHLAGIAANLGFLARLAAHPPMRDGTLDTGLIARAGAALTDEPAATAEDLALAAACLAGLAGAVHPLAGWRAWGPGTSRLQLVQDETVHDIALARAGVDGIAAETPLGPAALTLALLGGSAWRVEASGRVWRVHLHRHGDTVTLATPGGRRLTLARRDPRAAAAAAAAGASGDTVAAPLPGLVQSVAVAAGDGVIAGQVLAVMEAMKMEHTLRAPRDGTVARVAAAAGDQVAEGTVLLALEPEA
ncbi:MAG: biotin carboxylase N-terminal domain-containing protein [Pseudomonadota bacterium]